MLKEYKISYYLRNMYHTYLLDAENQQEAEERALRDIPETSKPLLHDFKAERYYRPW